MKHLILAMLLAILMSDNAFAINMTYPFVFSKDLFEFDAKTKTYFKSEKSAR